MSRNRTIDLYASIAHPWLMRYMEPKRHCIAATWVTIAVLKEYHIAAEPMAVKLRAINARLFAAMGRSSDGEAVDWQHEADSGACEVAIGYNTPEEMAERPDAWNGHLVAYVPSRGLMIDASLSQVARPQKDLKLPEVGVFSVGRRMPQPGDVHSFTGPHGEVIQYVASGDEDWRTMRDWTRAPFRYRECVREICAELTRSK